MFAKESQGADGTGYKLQFLERVNLLVFWFANNRSVAVNEKDALHVIFCVYGL